MSGMSGVGGASSPAMVTSAGVQKQAAAAAKPVVKDSDGDFDGTSPGQIDPKDSGKGINIDAKA